MPDLRHTMMLRNLADFAQGVRRQHQVGVQGYSGAAVSQPRGHGVHVQAASQPMASAAVAEAVASRPLDAGSGGDRHQARRRDPPGRGPVRKSECPFVGPAPGHRPERVHQFRMGRDHAGAAPLPFLTVMIGAAAKFRSRHCRSSASAWRSAERHSMRANSQGRPPGMAARICRTCSGVQ